MSSIEYHRLTMRTEHIEQLMKTAESCVEMGSIHKATIYFYRVVELSKPGEFTAELAWIRLCELYRSQSRYSDAIACIREAIELRPDESRYHLSLAELYFGLEDFEKATSLVYDAAKDILVRQDALTLLYQIAVKTRHSSAAQLAEVIQSSGA